MSVSTKIARFLREGAERIERMTPEPASTAGGGQALLDEYVAGMPSAQNAIDTLPGWNTALPPEVPVTAGAAHLHHDPRILWAFEQFGPLEGRRVLELGPLEASHTYMIEGRGAAVIDAIEANKLSFLRCLVVKELLGLKTARFHLGDFIPWLEATTEKYDLVVASGVLYHMVDPIRLLELMAQASDALYLWTHYASDAAMPVGDPRRLAFVGETRIEERHGMPVRLHDRSYHGAWKNKSFCGGMHDIHRWIERDDIPALLGRLGFDDVRIAHDDPGHQFGPSFSIFARRTGGAS